MSIAPRARAASRSIRPTPRCESPTSRRASSSRCRTRSHSCKTARRRCGCCARASMSRRLPVRTPRSPPNAACRSVPASARRRSARTTSPRAASPTTGSSSRRTTSTRSSAGIWASSPRPWPPRRSAPGSRRRRRGRLVSPCVPPSTDGARRLVGGNRRACGCGRREPEARRGAAVRRGDRPRSGRAGRAPRGRGRTGGCALVRRHGAPPRRPRAGRLHPRQKGFRRIELAVDKRVLIPRPETELLVEVALEFAPATVLDVGTGSGAVALAVADELAVAEVVATDTSLDALAVAKANADRLGLSDRIRFEYGSAPADCRLSSSWCWRTCRMSKRRTGRGWLPRFGCTSRGRP